MPGSHYDTLGVAPDASADEIRRAYRSLARRFHPDTHPGASVAAVAAAQRKMAVVAAAYAVLADPRRREAYDRSLGLYRPPKPNAPHRDWSPLDHSGDDDRFDRLGLDDEPAQEHHAAGDLVMLVPAALAVMAVVTFALGVMVQSHRLWALGIVLAPVAVAGFLAAPLVSMLRARTRARNRSEPGAGGDTAS